MPASQMMQEDLTRMHRDDLRQDFRRNALWTWIERHLQPGRAIDVGGGSGYMTRRLLAAGLHTVLVEPDQTLAGISQHRLQATGDFQLVAKSVQELDARELGKFENVLCLDVLEHVEDDVEALEKLVDLMSPASKLIISVPAMPHLYGSRDVAYGHHRRYTKSTLRALLQAGNLALLEVRYWNMLGVLPYYFYEKVLGRPITDTLRQREGGIVSRFIRWILSSWLVLEGSLPLPFGLSLLTVAYLPPDPGEGRYTAGPG